MIAVVYGIIQGISTGTVPGLTVGGRGCGGGVSSRYHRFPFALVFDLFLPFYPGTPPKEWDVGYLGYAQSLCCLVHLPCIG